MNGGSQHPEKRKSGGHGPTLADEIEHLLPTPTAMDSRASGGDVTSSNVTLTDATVRGRGLMPTRIGDTHVHPAEVGPREVLRGMRDSDGAKAIREAARGSDSIPGEADVFSVLREHEGSGDEGRTALASEETPSGLVRDVWHNGGTACASHRPESGEQRPHEPSDAMRLMSPPPALAGGPGEEDGSSADGLSDSARAWGGYARAIHRWEMVLGRPSPSPTEPTGKDGAHRLSARAVEFMMGLPAGWVTDPAIWDGMKPSAARNAQLKACGNGVVPQQAAEATRRFLAWAEGERRAAA